MASTIRHMSKQLPPSRTAPQFVVRFPDEEMRDRIKRDAENDGRSMNAQIIFMLQAFFDGVDRENYLNSPEYIEDLERSAREALPDANFKSFNEHIAEQRADKEADLVADKVVSKLISTEEFVAKIQRALLGLDKDGNPIDYNPPRTPTVPGQNAPKGGSKQRTPKK